MPPSQPRRPGRVGGALSETSFTGAAVSFAELLRAALNDPSSVRTSQVSWDMGRGILRGWHPPRTGHLGTRSTLSWVQQCRPASLVT